MVAPPTDTPVSPLTTDEEAVGMMVVVVASVFHVGSVLAADFLCLLILGGDMPTLSLAFIAFEGLTGAARFTGLLLIPALPLLLLLLVLFVVITVVVAAAAAMVEGLGDEVDDEVTLADSDVAVIGTAKEGVMTLIGELVTDFNAVLELVKAAAAVVVAVAAVDGVVVMLCSF